MFQSPVSSYQSHPIDRFKVPVAVHLFLIKENKILLLRRFQTGYEDGNYSVPAGHIEGNETATAAMLREAKEEVCLDLRPDDIHFVHVMHRKNNDERVDFFFVTEHWDGEPRIGEPNKCNELLWVPLTDLPQNTIEYIRSAISFYLQRIHFSEVGWRLK